MYNIADYLTSLITQKNKLVQNLTAKGINANANETFNTLVPKVLNISGENLNQGINKKHYSFGVLSDVHLKDTTIESGDETDSVNKFQTALSYYQDNEVDLICIAGDVIAHNRIFTDKDNPHPYEYTETSEKIYINEINLFKTLKNNFNGDIFACAGNHDVWANGYSESQPSGYTPVGMDQVITTSHPDYVQYKGKTCREIWEENINPVNVSFEKSGDVFIFLSMQYWNYANFCRPEDITWLSQQLELHKNKRVFLFKHLPMANIYDGPGATAPGLILNTGTRADQFRNLINQYPNVIWFNGHTHYSLDFEETYDSPNTYFANGEPIHIHCPSLAYIRREGNPYTNMYGESEGYIVDVYASHIVLRGINFKEGTNGLPITIAAYSIKQ